MNSRDFRNLTEAYTNIYGQEEETFFFKEDIDLLSDSDIDEAVEEAVYELLDEGFTLEEIDQAFDDFDDSFIAETPRPATRRKPTQSYDELKVKTYSKDDDKAASKPPSKKEKAQAELRAKRLAAKSSEDSTRSARETASKASKTTDADHSDAVARSKSASMGRALSGGSSSSSSKSIKIGKGKSSSPANKVSKSVKKTTAKVTVSGAPVRAKMTSGDDRASDRKPSPSSSSSSSSSPSSSSSGSSSSFGYKTKTGEKVDKFAHKVKQIRDKVGSSISKKNIKSLGRKVLTTTGKAAGVFNSARKKQERKEMRPQVTMSNSYDAYDIMLDFIVENGVAESYEEAEWLMANVFDADDVKMVLEITE